ncbi:hypothetical protein CHS0354_002241 [Potamilus streckersoni]|uniref:Uncharacterized protein n=1 Tax=Potamilus streckersoni TaxID=2493646 RepID=A0AAE0TCA0_9BIVA|nr:hypothetical protein CHS0354_002241 [Potamilus streckersoni]
MPLGGNGKNTSRTFGDGSSTVRTSRTIGDGGNINPIRQCSIVTKSPGEKSTSDMTKSENYRKHIEDLDRLAESQKHFKELVKDVRGKQREEEEKCRNLGIILQQHLQINLRKNTFFISCSDLTRVY